MPANHVTIYVTKHVSRTWTLGHHLWWNTARLNPSCVYSASSLEALRYGSPAYKTKPAKIASQRAITEDDFEHSLSQKGPSATIVSTLADT